MKKMFLIHRILLTYYNARAILNVGLQQKQKRLHLNNSTHLSALWQLVDSSNKQQKIALHLAKHAPSFIDTID